MDISISNSKPLLNTNKYQPLDIQCYPTDNIEIADFAIVGEQSSSLEIKAGQPLVSTVGANFDRICANANLPRYSLYLTNACKTNVPVRKLFDVKKGTRHQDWYELQSMLVKELTAFNGKVIICMGTLPMLLLLDDPKIDDINLQRGSIYRADDYMHLRDHLPGKFIALTQHPSTTTMDKSPLNSWNIIMDFNKFKRLRDDPKLLDDTASYLIEPSYEEVITFLQDVLAFTPETSVDIEANPKYMTCFALTSGPYEGMSIPLVDNSGNYWSANQETEILILFAKILNASSIKKIFQHGMYDVMYLLRTHNMTTDNFAFDTLLAQHLIYPDFPKGLDFLVAAYTFHPYHKGAGKKAHASVKKNWQSYWLYNCQDAVYTHQIAIELRKQLAQHDQEEAMEYQMDLHKPLMEMEWNGIATDPERIQREKLRIKRKYLALQHGLWKLTGRELSIGSNKQMVDYFYNELKIKPYKNKEGNPTCNSVALSRLSRKKHKCKAPARLAFKMRKLNKLLTTYFIPNTDADHKLRCHHKISGTVSGRISTTKTFFGTGTNLQNQPLNFKKYLRADPGYWLMEFDKRQAESHIVAVLCHDQNLLDIIDSGKKVHTYNASIIFGVPESEVNPILYKLGKMVVHARNYRMGATTCSNNWALQGIFKTIAETKSLLTSYDVRNPRLGRWQEDIITQVKKTRKLYNLFGRMKQFHKPLNDAVFGNAISYKPQSTVAEDVNRSAIRVSNDEKLLRFDFDLLVTVHDSIILQIHKSHTDELPEFCRMIKANMSHEFNYQGIKFVIDIDAKIGDNWDKRMIEFESFDDKTVMDAVEEYNKNA